MPKHLAAQVVFFNPPSAVAVLEAANEFIADHRGNHIGIWLASQDAAVGVHWTRLNFDQRSVALLFKHSIVFGPHRMSMQIQRPSAPIRTLQGGLHGDGK